MSNTQPKIKWTIIARGVTYDGKESLKELEKQLRAIQESTRYRFQKTVATWKKKPKFFVRKYKTGNVMGIDAGTENELWGMLDRGTEEHTIRGRRGVLQIRGGMYTPKTQPGLMSSSSGGFAEEADPFYRDEVHHPGTEARGWTGIITQTLERKLSSILQDVLVDWVDDVHARGPKQ